MIHFYSHANLSLWTRGVHQVQLDLPNQRLPLGYCDGTDEDEAELRRMAADEGVENLKVAKKLLKTGRAIWTLGEPRIEDDEFDEDIEPTDD